MKYEILILLIFSVLSGATFSQTPYSIKENYDELQPGIAQYYEVQSLATSSNHGAMGEGMPYVNASHLSMYEATGDKAYLVKLINEFIHIQSLRFDLTPYALSTGNPVWTQPTYVNTNVQPHDTVQEESYENGLIIWPMAKFYYMVKIDQTLASTSIPHELIYENPNNILSSGDLFNYGTFADWLKDKVDNTLSYLYDDYWDDDYGYKSEINNTNATIINKQAGFACALLYLGLPNNDNPNGISLYLNQAEIIANHYKGFNYYFDSGIPPTFTDNVVLEVNSNINAYQWHWNGWIGDEPREPEDMSHGAQTLLFPNAANEVGYYFTDEQMTRFHNTFTQFLWNGYHFNNNVFGTNDNLRLNNVHTNDKPFSYFKFSSLNYIPLHKFDNAYNSVGDAYSIIMDFYRDSVYNNDPLQHFSKSQMEANGLLNSGSMLYGLSEVVKAQWEKECVNLTLNNRDVVYDQDFFVKNNLNVEPNPDNNYDPNVSAKQAFADPNNVDDSQSPDYFKKDEFIIESGITVNMKAGESIDFKSGFHAKAGCFFHAFIDPTVECTDGYRYRNPDSDSSRIEVNQETATQRTGNAEKELKTSASAGMQIRPNPTSGKFTIELKDEMLREMQHDSPANVEIFNPLGQKVYSSSFSIQHSKLNIDFSSQSAGIYFVKVQTPEKIFTQKLVIQ